MKCVDVWYARLNKKQKENGMIHLKRAEASKNQIRLHELHRAALYYHTPEAVSKLSKYYVKRNKRLSSQTIKWYKYAADRGEAEAARELLNIFFEYAPGQVLLCGDFYANICLKAGMLDMIHKMADFYLTEYIEVRKVAPRCIKAKQLAQRLYSWCQIGYEHKIPEVAINLAVLFSSGIGTKPDGKRALDIIDNAMLFPRTDTSRLMHLKRVLLCTQNNVSEMQDTFEKGTSVNESLLYTFIPEGRTSESLQHYISLCRNLPAVDLHAFKYKYFLIWPWICWSYQTLQTIKACVLDEADKAELCEILSYLQVTLPVWLRGSSTWPRIAKVGFDVLIWNLVWISCVCMYQTEDTDPYPEYGLNFLKYMLEPDHVEYIRAIWLWKVNKYDQAMKKFRKLARSSVSEARFWIALYMYKSNPKVNQYSILDNLKFAANKTNIPSALNNLAYLSYKQKEYEEARIWMKRKNAS